MSTQKQTLEDGRQWNGLAYLHNTPQAGCTICEPCKAATVTGWMGPSTPPLPDFDARKMLRECRDGNGGFLTVHGVRAVAADPNTRLFLLLIRFGGCRCLAPAQDVARIIAALELAGDYCRDVSIPAGAKI